MSQEIISSVSNYGGKQPNNNQFIKQFIVAEENVATWVYAEQSSINNCVITPSSATNNVYIPADLIVGGHFSNPSDKNLKTNINSLDSTKIDNILNLNPISYTYNYDNENRKHFGLIAQEIEEYYPELVKNNFYLENNIYKTINYIELIPIMLSKIKNMQHEIDDLKKYVKKNM